MASALAALANASATFQVAGSGVVTEAATGNVIPVPSSVTVSLFLKADPRQARQFPGVNVIETLYSGYAVNPTTLDAKIRAGTQGTLTFGSGDAVDCEVVSVRAPYGDQGVIGEVLSSALGDAIVLRSADQS